VIPNFTIYLRANQFKTRKYKYFTSFSSRFIFCNYY